MPNHLQRHSLLPILALCSTFLGCSDPEDAQPDPSDLVEAEDAEDAQTTRIVGRLLDVDGRAVGGAEVSLLVGSVPVAGPTRSNADGHYGLDLPLDEVHTAWTRGHEVTVVFTSPREDEGAVGAQGDLVHLLPATLDQLVDRERVVADAELDVGISYVPRQGQGFPITDDLVQDGGVLTWQTSDSQYGEDFRVSLIIEPGSIHRGDDPQNEITLTLIEQAKAPMDIPEGGFGPLWTIQPRDIVFDPPARIRIEGQEFPVMGPSDMQPGDVTELYGASLETGWKLFGDIELVERNDGRIVLETPTGVVSHGAWGHVFNNTDNDYGMLVECFDKYTLERIQCAVLNDNTYWYQDPDNYNLWDITNLCVEPDFVPPAGGGYDDAFLTCDQWDFSTSSQDGNHMVYASDGETRCRSCGGDAAKYVVALTANNEVGEAQGPVYGGVTAFALCPEEESTTDMAALWDSIYERLGLSFGSGAIVPYEDAEIAEEVQVELAWRNFSKAAKIYLPPAVNCAE